MFGPSHRDIHAPPFLTLVAVFAFSLSLFQLLRKSWDSTRPPPPPRSPPERPALTAVAAHSARPRPMVTPISCFQCFPKPIAMVVFVCKVLAITQVGTRSRYYHPQNIRDYSSCCARVIECFSEFSDVITISADFVLCSSKSWVVFSDLMWLAVSGVQREPEDVSIWLRGFQYASRIIERSVIKFVLVIVIVRRRNTNLHLYFWNPSQFNLRGWQACSGTARSTASPHS